MALSNLGFETAGSGAGDAASWAVTVTATAERLGLFAGLSGALYEQEDFTEGWGADGYLFQLVPLVDTELGSFDGDSIAYVLQAVEDFEEGWSSNHTYAFNQASLEDGTLDDFSSGWGTTYSSQSAVEDGVVEDFTTGWGHDGYLFAQGSVEDGLFNTKDGVQVGIDTEGFEQTMGGEQRIGLGDASPNVLHFPAAHGFLDTDQVLFRVEAGKLPVPLSEGTPYYVQNMLGVDVQLYVDQFLLTVIPIQSTGEGVCWVSGDVRRYWPLGQL